MTRLSRLASLEKLRTVRLDARALAAQASAQAEEQARAAAWQVMCTTMSEEHARLVSETYQQVRQHGWESVRGHRAERLTRACYDALLGAPWERAPPYSGIADEVRFAMPPQVAEVYLKNAGAMTLRDCSACGYEIPLGTPNREERAQGLRWHSYFERCPLCGGEVGWYAYFESHRLKQDGSQASE